MNHHIWIKILSCPLVKLDDLVAQHSFALDPIPSPPFLNVKKTCEKISILFICKHGLIR